MGFFHTCAEKGGCRVQLGTVGDIFHIGYNLTNFDFHCIIENTKMGEVSNGKQSISKD